MSGDSRSEIAVDWLLHVLPDGGVVERTWASVREGALPWSELRDDEITRGKMVGRNGRLLSPCPSDLHRPLLAEHMRRLTEEMRSRADGAVAVIRDVSDGTILGTAADQFRASQYLLERTIGKIPDKLEVTATVKPYEELVTSILVDGTEDDEVLEAEVVEEAGMPTLPVPTGTGSAGRAWEQLLARAPAEPSEPLAADA